MVTVFPTRAKEDLVTEVRARLGQSSYRRGDVLNLDDEPVPSTGCGRGVTRVEIDSPEEKSTKAVTRIKWRRGRDSSSRCRFQHSCLAGSLSPPSRSRNTLSPYFSTTCSNSELPLLSVVGKTVTNFSRLRLLMAALWCSSLRCAYRSAV